MFWTAGYFLYLVRDKVPILYFKFLNDDQIVAKKFDFENAVKGFVIGSLENIFGNEKKRFDIWNIGP